MERERILDKVAQVAGKVVDSPAPLVVWGGGTITTIAGAEAHNLTAILAGAGVILVGFGGYAAGNIRYQKRLGESFKPRVDKENKH